MILALESAVRIPVHAPRAEADLLRPAAPAPAHPIAIPPHYATVIYQRCGHGASQKHVYIVGDSHRSVLTGHSSANAVRTQMEIYRIGEWLLRHEGVQLVLPEGFFRRKGPAAEPATPVAAGTARLPDVKPVDDLSLQEWLLDESVFTSAEILLRAHHDVRIRQVEDEQLYAAVGDFLRLTQSVKKSAYTPILFHRQLERLQAQRTAAILQNIPGVVETEFRSGSIDNRKAMLTIGLNHIEEIIRYLHATPTAALAACDADGDDPTELPLLRHDYGVTVILPRALADDHEARMLTRLGNGV